MCPSSRLSLLRPKANAHRANDLRRRMTDAELRLWYFLRDRRLDGWKFRRQVPLGPYIADFLCEEAGVIVEVDGGQHAEQVARDEVRSQWLEARGYAVVRFWNNDVLENIEGVLETLTPALSQGRGRAFSEP